MLFVIVGLVVVLQHTPRPVMGAPPSLLIIPPIVAVVCVIDVEIVIDRTGNVGGSVIKLSSLPYDVPTLFVA
jgi:hypothetical protein